LEEFRVITSNASAEYGLGIDQIITVTRAGTNQFHGVLSEFNRNRAYAAHYVLDHTPNTPYNRNDFGATLGGPVIKNKLFFLVSFERNIVSASSPQTASLPTDAMKAGNFANFSTPIIDPATNAPFPNGAIPSNRISPVAQGLLKYMVAPNSAGFGSAGTGTNYFGNDLTTEDSPRYNTRADYQPSSKDYIFGAYTYSVQGTHDGGGPGGLYNAITNNWGGLNQARFGWTRVISPHTTSEARGSFTRTRFEQIPTSNQNIDPGTILPGLNDQCCVDLTGGEKSSSGRFGGGLPEINISGYTGLTDNTHAADREDYISLSEDLTLERGSHTIKTGGFFWRSNYYWGGMYPNGRGVLDFTGRYTGDADFLLGEANDSQRSSAYQFGQFLDNFFGGFIQDDWKATPRLTLNIGLRYDAQTPSREVNNNQAIYLPSTNSLVTVTGTNQFPSAAVSRLLSTFPIETGVQAGLGHTDNTYNAEYFHDTLSPRLGLAYRLTSDEKTVFRAGGGIYRKYLTQNWMGLEYDLAAPFSLTENFYSPTGNNPYVTFANPFPGTGDIPSSPSIWSFPRNFPRPYTGQWTASLDREIFPRTLLRVTYAGSKLTHGQWDTDYNEPRVTGPGTLQGLRPFQPWGTITYVTTGWDAKKNQMQVEFLRRMSDSTIQVQYQLTKAEDDFDFNLQSPWLYREPGNTSNVPRHNAVVSWVANLPVGNGRKYLASSPRAVEYLIGGWEVSGIASFSSGVPFDVTYTSPLVGYPNSGRAELIGNWQPAQQSESEWFNPNAFTSPVAFTFSNLGRNALYGPGSWNVDAALMKNFKFFERWNLQFRAEGFNVFNHPNWGLPDSNISYPGAGEVFTFGTPRTVQFGLKLTF
jgi:hypothetical protein